MLILSNDEIQRILKMKDCVEAMEAAFYDFSMGQGVNQASWELNSEPLTRPGKQ